MKRSFFRSYPLAAVFLAVCLVGAAYLGFAYSAQAAEEVRLEDLIGDRAALADFSLYGELNQDYTSLQLHITEAGVQNQFVTNEQPHTPLPSAPTTYYYTVVALPTPDATWGAITTNTQEDGMVTLYSSVNRVQHYAYISRYDKGDAWGIGGQQAFVASFPLEIFGYARLNEAEPNEQGFTVSCFRSEPYQEGLSPTGHDWKVTQSTCLHTGGRSKALLWNGKPTFAVCDPSGYFGGSTYIYTVEQQEPQDQLPQKEMPELNGLLVDDYSASFGSVRLVDKITFDEGGGRMLDYQVVNDNLLVLLLHNGKLEARCYGPSGSLNVVQSFEAGISLDGPDAKFSVCWYDQPNSTDTCFSVLLQNIDAEGKQQTKNFVFGLRVEDDQITRAQAFDATTLFNNIPADYSSQFQSGLSAYSQNTQSPKLVQLSTDGEKLAFVQMVTPLSYEHLGPTAALLNRENPDVPEVPVVGVASSGEPLYAGQLTGNFWQSFLRTAVGTDRLPYDPFVAFFNFGPQPAKQYASYYNTSLLGYYTYMSPASHTLIDQLVEEVPTP